MKSLEDASELLSCNGLFPGALFLLLGVSGRFNGGLFFLYFSWLNVYYGRLGLRVSFFCFIAVTFFLLFFSFFFSFFFFSFCCFLRLSFDSCFTFGIVRDGLNEI